MFTKKHAKDAAAPPALPNVGHTPEPVVRSAPARQASGTPSVIGADLSITGNLESTGEVRIEGRGQIQQGRQQFVPAVKPL